MSMKIRSDEKHRNRACTSARRVGRVGLVGVQSRKRRRRSCGPGTWAAYYRSARRVSAVRGWRARQSLSDPQATSPSGEGRLCRVEPPTQRLCSDPAPVCSGLDGTLPRSVAKREGFVDHAPVPAPPELTRFADPRSELQRFPAPPSGGQRARQQRDTVPATRR